MRKQLLLLLAITFAALGNTYASDESPKSCRLAVVLAYLSVGEDINPGAFSNSSFDQLNITIDDFNAMSSEEQDAIYMRVKPIEVMVEETIMKLSRYIDRYLGSPYEAYLIDEINAWRDARSALRSCTK